jgi:hypothetical protein
MPEVKFFHTAIQQFCGDLHEHHRDISLTAVSVFATNPDTKKILTYLLALWSRVLPEKLTHPKLLKKFPAFYGTRRFIIAFTRARNLSLSRARLIQSMTLPHPTSRRSILILSSYLRLGFPSGLLPSGFPTKAL